MKRKDEATIMANRAERIKVYSEAYSAINRMRLATGTLGQQYGGNRDIYQALGYPKVLTYDDYLGKYSRQDISAAIIDKPVDTTWRGEVILQVEKDAETALEKGWIELEEVFKIKSLLQRVDRLSSIGNYAILLLGLDDANTAEAMMDPVKEGKRKLVFIKPISQPKAVISTYSEDPNDPRYGLPLYYDVTIRENLNTVKVHYSRVIHVTGKILDDEVLGVPYLQQVYNRLEDLEKIMGGSAEMFWRGARPGYQGKVEKDYTISPADKEKFMENVEEYENDLRRILINEGVDMQALETQVSDPTPHVDVQIQMISAKTNIPKRILTGSERGELASTQDLTQWYASIEVRREEHATPKIVRPLVDALVKYGVLADEVYVVDYTDLYTSSDKEKVEVGKIRATALKEYTANPGAEAIITPEVFLTHFLGFNDTEVQMIIEAMQALPPEQPVSTEEAEIIAEEQLNVNKKDSSIKELTDILAQRKQLVRSKKRTEKGGNK